MSLAGSSPPQSTCPSPPVAPSVRPNFRQGDWNGFATFLTGIDWHWIDEISADCTEMCGHLLEILRDGIERHVPFCASKKKPLALPTRLRAMRRLRLSAFRSRHSSPHDLVRFTALDRKYRSALKRFFVSQEASLLSSARRGLYRHYKTRTSLPAAYPNPPLMCDGIPSSDEKCRADAFAETFSAAYSLDRGLNPELGHPPAQSCLRFVDFSRHRVEKVLDRLVPKLSAGPDGIPPLLLKKLAKPLAVPLSLLFSRSVANADVPTQFQILRCTAIPKQGKDQSLPSNWRPISIASSLCKALELGLNSQLCSYLEANSLIHDSQFGYRQGRSTQGQLATFVQSVSDKIAAGKSIHTLWVDCSRAFDTPPHRLIVRKLALAAGISGNLLDWMHSFIAGRSAYVSVGSSSSEKYALVSGFAQGSPLSATLWTVYINDLLVGLSRFVEVGCYADDVRCHSESADDLQRAALFLEKWCSDWQLSLSPAKCVYAVFGKEPPQPPLLSGTPVPLLAAAAHRDLGILIDTNLSFAPHVSSIVAKAKGISARILRSFHSSNPHVLFAAFTVYVRPHLEYASVAWNCIPRSLADKIESVQKDFSWRCMRRAGLKRIPYSERLKFLGSESLASRRKAYDATFCHAILRGKHSCPVISAEPRAATHPARFAPRASATPSARKAPRSRLARLYNSLPFGARSLSLSCFKPTVRDYLARL